MSQSAVAPPESSSLAAARSASPAFDRTLLLLILAGVVGVTMVLWDALRDRTISAGSMAPDFSVTTEDGKTLTRQNFGGKVLVLNFWASWCPPCAAETPSMKIFHDRLKDQGVVLLAISVDKNPEKYRNFLKRFGVNFATAHDPAAKVSDSYATYRYPESYVINKDGRVVEKIVGRKNWADENFIRSIQALL